MSARLVYIAGPYAAPTPEERAENVRRVKVLSLFALSMNLVPVSVHALVEAGHLGRDDVPKERERGIAAACAQAGWVAFVGGDLWIITRDDGTLSAGCCRELDAFSAAPTNPASGGCVSRTWEEWSEIVRSVRRP